MESAAREGPRRRRARCCLGPGEAVAPRRPTGGPMASAGHGIAGRARARSCCGVGPQSSRTNCRAPLSWLICGTRPQAQLRTMAHRAASPRPVPTRQHQARSGVQPIAAANRSGVSAAVTARGPSRPFDSRPHAVAMATIRPASHLTVVVCHTAGGDGVTGCGSTLCVFLHGSLDGGDVVADVRQALGAAASWCSDSSAICAVDGALMHVAGAVIGLPAASTSPGEHHDTRRHLGADVKLVAARRRGPSYRVPGTVRRSPNRLAHRW